MTLKELHNEICALGFDSSLAFNKGFVSSVTRALYEIYNEKIITESKKFFVREALPTMRIKEIRYDGEGEIVLPLTGKAVSMRLFGNGVISFDGPDGSVYEAFNCDGDYYKKFIMEGSTTLTLMGPFSFTVCDLVTFDVLESEDEADIPNGDGTAVINLKKSIPDFMTLIALPTDKYGRAIKSATFDGEKLYLSNGYMGEVTLTYRRNPRTPTLEAQNAQLDIPPEYLYPLSVLTAFYVLLDDDSTLAEVYRGLYERSMKSCQAKHPSYLGERYEVSDGWA